MVVSFMGGGGKGRAEKGGQGGCRSEGERKGESGIGLVRVMGGRERVG